MTCSQNANGSQGGQYVSNGGRILLKRFVGYMRCCDNLQVATNYVPTTNLQALEWADGDKNGKVTIVDESSMSYAWGTHDAYWAHPLYGSSDPDTVNIGDASTLATYFDYGI